MTIQLGIFAKTFPRPSYKETLRAVADHGFSRVHWNMSCSGLPSMLDEIDPALLRDIRATSDSLGIVIEGLSGTFNMIHPDPLVRRQGLRQLEVLASACDPLGTRMISLCTGTRTPDDMWKRHPDNDSPEAWADLFASLTFAVDMAERYDITLGIEPEFGNVINSAPRARRLLDQFDSPRLGIILDPANLIEGVAADHIESTLDEAFTLLGDRIISAHAKDRDANGTVQPAGKGIVPWPRFMTGLTAVNYRGSLILHGLAEADVPPAIAFLQALG